MSGKTTSSSSVPESRELLNCHSDPALLLDENFRILAVNHAYRHTFGGRRLQGRFCFEVSHALAEPCGDRGGHCPLVIARDSGRPERTIHVHPTVDGTKYMDVEVLPVADGSGRCRYFVEIIRSIGFASPDPSPVGLVGSAPAFIKMLEMVQRVAAKPFPVLLQGETGTGKELVARAIHDASRQSGGPFVPVECSGLAENLFESELFGHKKGAFTGAYADKQGLVETANGGTLFLDEVGEIPYQQQVKLLRVLETLSFRQVGDTRSQRVDFRLICATNQDLAAMMAAGSFRPDLYYRISAFPIRLPPLRDRRADIPLVARSLLDRIDGSQRTTLSKEALIRLQGYAFPGNIRELQNMLERACLLSGGGFSCPNIFPMSPKRAIRRSLSCWKPRIARRPGRKPSYPSRRSNAVICNMP